MQELRSLCAAAEAAYPLTDEVGIARALHLAALEWLGLKGGDAAMEREALALARTIVDAHPAPEQRVLADYVLARQTALNTGLNRRQTPEPVRAFYKPYLKTDAEWLALPLAMSLASEVGNSWLINDELYRLLAVGQASNTNHPEIRALLQTVWDSDFAHVGQGQFTRLDGTPLNIPDDLTGRVAVIHFCTATAEPGAPWAANLLPLRPGFGIIRNDNGVILISDELTSTTDMVIVAVNLDRTREAAEAMAKKHPDWIVAQAGPDNPIVRRYDIYPFPATWVLTKRGAVFTSDESIDLASVLSRDLNCQAYFDLQPVFQNPAQWQTVCNVAFHAKECFDTVNESIAEILDAKQMMDTGLGLREGMPWAAKPDIGALLQTAAQADCLRVSAAADGNEECKLLAKFFSEVPASAFALPLGSNAPSAPAGLPQRYFRLKRLE